MTAGFDRQQLQRQASNGPKQTPICGTWLLQAWQGGPDVCIAQALHINLLSAAGLIKH